MTLSPNLNTNEKDKFTTDSNGETCVRTCGEAVPSGLANEGRISLIEVNDAAWTRVVASPLTARRAAAIQATNGFGEASPAGILINYALSTSPAVAPVDNFGSFVEAGAEKFYDVNDQVDFWIRVVPGGGTFNIVFEEIA